MNKKFYLSATLLLVFLYPIFSYAQETEKSLPNTFSLQIDQDVLHPLNEDRNYTMGVKMEWELNGLDSNWFYNSIRKTNDFLSFSDSGNYLLNSISLGYGAFTPDSLGTVNIIEGDRPYAGVLALTAGVKKVRTRLRGFNRFNNPKRTFTFSYTNISVGMLGLDVGRPIQSILHKWNNPGDYTDTISYPNPIKPYGWDNQVSKGGGIVGLFTHGQKFLLTRKYLNFLINRRNGKLDWQEKREKIRFLDKFTEISAGYEIMSGYYNNAQLNGQIRIGFIDPTNWYFRSSSAGAFNKGVRDKTYDDEYKEELKPKASDFELYVFANGTANYMVYNSLLRGQMIAPLRLNSTTLYTLDGSEVEPLFYELKIGVTIRIAGFNISYIPVSLRTSEINTTDYFERTHHWSEISLKWNCK